MNLQIVNDDGFPQYICNSCVQLLNSAYMFKTLCEKSDQELRISEQNQIKEEINDYCASVLDDTIQNDLSDNELKLNDNEIMISDEETNEDALPMDNEMPMNEDHSSSESHTSLDQKHEYYLRVPFPEQEYDGEIKTEKTCIEITEEPTIDGYDEIWMIAFCFLALIVQINCVLQIGWCCKIFSSETFFGYKSAVWNLWQNMQQFENITNTLAIAFSNEKLQM